VERHHNVPSERKPLRDVRPDLPDAFIRVVERAVAQQPEERYQSSGEFEAALASTLPTPAPGSAPRSLRWKLVSIAAGVLLFLGIAASLYRSGSGGTASAGSSPVTSEPTTAPPPTAAAVPGTYRIHAVFNREQDGTDVRVQDGTRLSPSDKLSLDVTVSQPVYLYVVNEDDHGDSYLLFPLPGQMPTNPLPAGHHRLPGMLEGSKLYWQVTTAGGREHFLLIASPRPSPTFDKMFGMLPRPTLDKPVAQLSRADIGVLRSVGGLAVTTPVNDQQLRTTSGFATPLTGKEESASGVWIRQATLANPD
jgi:hypothetical protein